MTFDLAIIGGGINGCGIARDAAGRGLKVLLCEQSDLASATSSASTKLIHGGLRYLEQFEFKLVRESLSERETLWSMAPHIIWPLRLVLPHNSDLRPAWLIRLGLFIYDNIGGRKLLPPSRSVDLSGTPLGTPLKASISKGFEYSDCWVDDSRLVVLNAMDAARRGADIRTRTQICEARREEHNWVLRLRDTDTGQEACEKAKVIINAAGPWSSQVANSIIGLNSKSKVRLVKGSHIVVPKLVEHDRAYIFQNADKRIIFAIPYETDFTLIGTTDVECHSAVDPKITNDEIGYLCSAASAYFQEPVTREQIVWTYSGVRPLYDDGDGNAQAVTRDYRLERHGPASGPAALSVFGGKLTTYRILAEEVLERLEDCFPHMLAKWTKGAVLPGGEFLADGFEEFVRVLNEDYPAMPISLVRRLARAYGTCARDILGHAKIETDLGVFFGADLSEVELLYLVDKEWARSSADVLWRRSKLGLRLSKEQVKQLDKWFEQRKYTATDTVTGGQDDAVH